MICRLILILGIALLISSNASLGSDIAYLDTLPENKIPENLKNTDIEDLISLIRDYKPDKQDDFETDADYENRLKQSITIKELETDKLIFFKDMIFDEKTLGYDAENKRWYFQSGSARAKNTRHNLDSYSAFNAFGAKTDVSHYYKYRYSIVVTNEEDFPERTFETPYYRKYNHVVPAGLPKSKANFIIDMNPDEARKLKALGIAYAVSIDTDKGYPVHTWSDHHKATYNDPNEYTEFGISLRVRLHAIYFYNLKTQEILKEFTIKN